MTLPKLIAGALASVIMSLIWYLASPHDAQPQSAGDLGALRTPVTLTLLTGRQVSGEIQGLDSLCADWTAAFQASPETVVLLPDGSRLTGADVRAVTVGKTDLDGVEGMGKVSDCPATLTVRAAGSPADPAAGLGELKDAAGTADSLKKALDWLGNP